MGQCCGLLLFGRGPTYLVQGGEAKCLAVGCVEVYEAVVDRRGSGSREFVAVELRAGGRKGHGGLYRARHSELHQVRVSVQTSWPNAVGGRVDLQGGVS